MEYRGCEVTQSPLNNHIIIAKDGRCISHVSCTEKKSDDELKKIVDFMLEMREDAQKVYFADKGEE